MPSNYTQHYKLNQWAAEDKVQRTDFNADNAKIDAALAEKAEAAALTALSRTVAQKGNCRMISGSYTGSGTYGSNSPNRLTFPFPPLAVVIACQHGTAVLISGAPQGLCFMGHAYALWNVTWSGNGLSWYIFQSSNANQGSYRVNEETQMNETGVIYRYFALGAADN